MSARVDAPLHNGHRRPNHNLLPGEEDVDLYAVLSLGRDAKVEDVRKAYRRLALVYHPDKHAIRNPGREGRRISQVPNRLGSRTPSCPTRSDARNTIVRVGRTTGV